MNGTINGSSVTKGSDLSRRATAPYFFHSRRTGTAFDQLREGQAGTFDVGHGAKGPRGENVRLA